MRDGQRLTAANPSNSTATLMKEQRAKPISACKLFSESVVSPLFHFQSGYDMESGNMVCDMNKVINVLMQGDEDVRELEAWLGQPCSAEACKTLASKVESAFTSAISMARLLEQDNADNSARAFKEMERTQKKRKTPPRWGSQVRACSGSPMEEAPVDDGHTWRKYGQKDILGAKHPRGYYRCTYRHSHGCLATKQVQLSDDDDSVFNITYRGTHTCNYKLHGNPLPSPKEQDHISHQHQSPTQQQQLLEIYSTGLTVKTEGLSSDDQALNSSPSFPSTPMPVKPDSNLFMGNYSPTFVSAATSTESDYYSGSPFGMQNIHGFDSDIAEIISATMESLWTSSSLAGVDFPTEQICFDAEFPSDFT